MKSILTFINENSTKIEDRLNEIINKLKDSKESLAKNCLDAKDKAFLKKLGIELKQQVAPSPKALINIGRTRLIEDIEYYINNIK